MDPVYFQKILAGCKANDRKSQKELYKLFFGFSMKICLRYSENKEEAIEMVNDGFLKVFNSVNKVDEGRPFQSWLSTIMINTSIDHYRARIKRLKMEELNNNHDSEDTESIIAKLNYNDLIKLVQRLSISYRTVFYLFVIDGYNHEEISKMLSISVGTSKSNLFKARQQLKEMLKETVAGQIKEQY
jgi:RNA polymerase sigma factor (sigma-70 family)